MRDTYLGIIVLGGCALPGLWGLYKIVSLIVGAFLGGPERFEVDGDGD